MFLFYQIFSSHMVLQRRRPIRFSGTGKAGETVTVDFNGQTAETRISDSSEWNVEFPALEAGGPYTVTATCTGEHDSIVMDDILIGDVWMCSGQSNMEMPLWNTEKFYRAGNGEVEMANADFPQIRLYNCAPTRSISPYAPLNDLLGGRWDVCSPATAEHFTACGYFFGKQLFQDLNIPIGLVSASWGGTDIAAWISARKMAASGWAPYLPTLSEDDDKTQKFNDWNDYVQSEDSATLRQWLDDFNTECTYDSAITAIDFDDSSWMVDDGNVPTVPVPGRYAHRLTFTLPDHFNEKDLHVVLGNINDMDTTFLNGVRIGATGLDTFQYWAEIRKYPVPDSLLKPGKNVITVIHDDHYCNGICNFWRISFCGSNGVPYHVVPVCRSLTIHELPSSFPARPAITFGDTADIRSALGPNHPNTLFNSLIAPWLRYTFRGVIWYQGCHNNGEFSYYKLHKMLIEDWREQWGDPEMPFLIVQLAAFHMHTPDNRLTDTFFDSLKFPEYPPFAITREIQAQMADEFKNVATIVSFDKGDHSDIHPRDKQTLGFRLARKAEQILYNQTIIADGPVFNGMQIEKDKIRIFFKNAGSGLVTTDGLPPKGFVIGDRNGALLPADATIEGNTVVLSSPLVSEPHRARYAFTSFCFVNLTNREGFAAMPFRTDKVDYKAMMR